MRKAVTRTWLSLGVIAAATVLTGLGTSANGTPSHKMFRKIMPITAKFIPALRETQYSFTMAQQDLGGTLPVPTSVHWQLHLELVDRAGAPNPGVPGSGAAVDLGCTNAGVGIPNPMTEQVTPNAKTYQFVWHHPDAADSVPPGRYHCDHLEEGPRGHQGLVTVTVTGRGWECTESYKGTNSSTAKGEAETLAGVVRDVTASYPDCFSIG